VGQGEERHSNQGASSQHDCYNDKGIALACIIALHDCDDRYQGDDNRKCGREAKDPNAPFGGWKSVRLRHSLSFGG
jgi:hypothetical protein